VPERPRTVRVSQELLASDEGHEYQSVLDEWTRKIETGLDLAPHLSRSARVAYFPPSAIQQGKEHLRKDRDLLLSDWGIHHLHLSTEPGGNGLVERTRDLLFVIFRPDVAYLIGIYPHAKWAPLRALEIVVRNWPDAELLLRSLSDLQLTQVYTDDERLQLRNGGVTGAVEIDGRVYMPRGQATDHTPFDVTRRVMTVRHALTQVREGQHAALLTNWETWCDARSGPPPVPRWRAAIREDDLGLIREACFVRLASLP
jgi:hypothetical protein